MNHNRPHSSRRGIVLIAVMVCMVVVMLLCAAVLRVGLVERSAVRADERRVQAEWLAESGIERAAAQLARASDYAGETWQVAAEELGGRDAGRVEIAVEKVESHPNHRRVIVQADFAVEPTRRVRQTKSIVIELKAD